MAATRNSSSPLIIATVYQLLLWAGHCGKSLLPSLISELGGGCYHSYLTEEADRLNEVRHLVEWYSAFHEHEYTTHTIHTHEYNIQTLQKKQQKHVKDNLPDFCYLRIIKPLTLQRLMIQLEQCPSMEAIGIFNGTALVATSGWLSPSMECLGLPCDTIRLQNAHVTLQCFTQLVQRFSPRRLLKQTSIYQPLSP